MYSFRVGKIKFIDKKTGQPFVDSDEKSKTSTFASNKQNEQYGLITTRSIRKGEIVVQMPVDFIEMFSNPDDAYVCFVFFYSFMYV